ncbi:DNA helicase Pif1-like protein [Artemisia annua]|uniref:DNA helicase Pif1-like protein n=1 Tax=Artemisia annua TaxID=35608 RepID=A0A2U1MSH2_ARTAN|nr:DNA helicase Pif1-like protein [Artemisia annua]
MSTPSLEIYAPPTTTPTSCVHATKYSDVVCSTKRSREWPSYTVSTEMPSKIQMLDSRKRKCLDYYPYGQSDTGLSMQVTNNADLCFTTSDPYKFDGKERQCHAYYDKHVSQESNIPFPEFTRSKKRYAETALYDIQTDRPSKLQVLHYNINHNAADGIRYLLLDKKGQSCVPSIKETTTENYYNKEGTNGFRKRRGVCSRKRRRQQETECNSQHADDNTHNSPETGDCDWSCEYCNASFWYGERLKGSSTKQMPKYNRCCAGGKIHIEQEVDPPNQLFNVVGIREYQLPTSDILGAILFESGPNTRTDYDVIIHKKGEYPQRINKLHSSYMSLQFPLLFIHGQPGYNTQMELQLPPTNRRKPEVSMNMYYMSQIHERPHLYEPIKEAFQNVETRHFHEGRRVFADYTDMNYLNSMFQLIHLDCIYRVNEKIVPQFVLEFYSLLNLTTDCDGEIYVNFTIHNQMISYPLPTFGQALGVPTEGQCTFTHEWSLDALARSSHSYGKYATIPPSPEEIRTIVQNNRYQPERSVGPELRTRSRRSVGSRSFAHGTSFNSNDNDDVSHDEGTLQVSTPSPVTYVNSLPSGYPQVFQDLPPEDRNRDNFSARLTQIMNMQHQNRDESRGAWKSIGKGIHKILGKKK